MKEYLKNNWTLQGSLPYIQIQKDGKKTRDLSRYYVTDKISATVPGGIHLDLYKNGIIENPYIDQNSRLCEWTENRWWIYETEVKVDKNKGDKRCLVFEGLDYDCEIFIDDDSVGTHANMFAPKKIDITKLEGDSFNLKVLFKGVTEELGQYGNTSETKTQQSRFGFGWDFATRLVNIGIWKDVYIEYISGAEMESANIKTDAADGKGYINAQFSFTDADGKEAEIELLNPLGESIGKANCTIEDKISAKFEVENPLLWYPNGMGNQPLYKVVLRFGAEEYSYNVGIRSLKFERNPGAGEDALPYTVIINGERVYIRGVNKVPLDHIYGNVSYENYEYYVKAMVNMNVNLVRCWGGGIIEKEEFYDLCDKYGILVWQDFIQSSSGGENVPSKHPDFLKKMRENVICASREKRNHTCLTFWCGGNELTDINNNPVTYEDENIGLIKSILDREDPDRFFLPSTPSGPVYYLEFDKKCHDAHGQWEYHFRDHYKNYNKLSIMLHAETGISGPSASTKMFLSENNLSSEKWSANRHHDEYWWHSFERDKKMLGEFDDCNEYIPFGQWIQAEGLRYILENERRMSPRCCGSMIWQFNEPWPTADCTTLIEYFGMPKMAYYWIKKVYGKSNVSLKYDSIYGEDKFSFELCRDGDTKESDCDVKVEIIKSSGEKKNEYTFKYAQLPISLEEKFEGENEIYMVRVTHNGESKEYFFSSDVKTPYRGAKHFQKAQIKAEIISEKISGNERKYEVAIENISDAPAYFINPKDKTMSNALLCEDAFFTLLPGESRKINISAYPVQGFFFDIENKKPELDFAFLNK